MTTQLFCALALACFFCCATLVSADGSYLVLTPRVVHPGWPLNMAVSIQKADISGMPITVKGTLTDKEGALVATESFAIKEGESKLLTMQIPAFSAQKNFLYRLRVEGFGGLTFDKTELLTLNANSTLVQVQTDKNIYKPGQLVRFRVLHINKDLQPVSTHLTAFILNTKGSKLERYDNISSIMGVVSREFQLSKFATLGIWTIQLQNTLEEVLYQHTFKVEEYVLPRFSVEVTPDPDFLVWGIYNQPPGIIVKSKYTYGKPVQGECVLTLGQQGSSIKQKLSQRLLDSESVEFTDIQWDYLIGDKPSVKKTLLAQVEVTDVNGRTEYGEAKINIFRDDYKVEILPKTPEIIHSGLQTEFYVRVSDHYNRPIPGKEMEVTLTLPGITPIKIKVAMSEGEDYATVKFTPSWGRSPSEGTSSAIYHDLKGSLKVALVEDVVISARKAVSWYFSFNMEMLRIDPLQSMDIPRGQPYSFKLSRTRLSNPVMYTIISQGIILDTGIVSGDEILVTPTFDMCPSARMVVYQFFDNQDGGPSEIVANGIEFSPALCMDKEVKVTFDAKQQRTGTDANLQINVVKKDGSDMPEQVHEVFYLAVDKSTVLLQGDTTVTGEKIMDTLASTNTWSYEATESTAFSVFNSIDVLAFTDAKIAEVREEPEIMFAMADNAIRRKSNAVEKEDSDDKKEPAPAQKKIRKDFPETWLWGHGSTTPAGQFRTQVRLPDTITSWQVSAFGINENGIVGSATPFQLTAFNPFFVFLNLPYSIKRGEVFSLTITVFNYRPQDVDAIVKIKMSDDFIITGGQLKDNYMEQPIKMLPNLASSVVFEVNASTIGKIVFNVVAQDIQDQAQRDEVIKELRVKPPGEERNQVMTKVMVLVDEPSKTERFEVSWPSEKIIEGSQRLQVKVTGQVLGQSLSNLNNLVRQPTGCGEQNMIGLVPNIYGATYIQQTNQENDKVLLEAMIKNMHLGYQRQVDLYKKSDGSYSAWATDAEGSTWLTAFVMKSFAAASKFIKIDKEVLSEAVSFMSTKQTSTGYFREDGRILHKDLQSGTSEDFSLTVYTLLSILETSEVMPTSELDRLLSLTIPLIIKETSTIISKSGDNAFLPSMTAYTLSLAVKLRSSIEQQLKQPIEALLSFIEARDFPWKKNGAGQSSSVTPTSGKSTVLMTAAYTLMTYLNVDKFGLAMEVMTWIQEQQNSRGGFGSTQDTVLVLQSLAEYGLYFTDKLPNGQVKVSVSGDENFSETLDISGSRSFLLQQLDLPVNTNFVEITLTGAANTIAFIKIVSYYNTPVTEVEVELESGRSVGGVDVYTRTRYMSDMEYQVDTCVSSTLEQGVGMYVATMSLPSGEVPGDSIEMMKALNPSVSQVEVEEGEGVIHYYMNDVPKNSLCLKTRVEKQMQFAAQEPGSVKLYSYYEPEYYQESEVKLPDRLTICQGAGCGRAPALPLTSLILTILICFMTSLLACV